MAGWIDLGFNELSTSTGVNDTFTTIDINAYPDGVTKTVLHSETKTTADNVPLKYWSPIDISFYIMAQTEDTYFEVNLSGGSFATEVSGATNATFNTTNIDSFGVGYQMMGFGGVNPDDNSDVMMLYDIKLVENVVQLQVEMTDEI